MRSSGRTEQKLVQATRPLGVRTRYSLGLWRVLVCVCSARHEARATRGCACMSWAWGAAALQCDGELPAWLLRRVRSNGRGVDSTVKRVCGWGEYIGQRKLGASINAPVRFSCNMLSACKRECEIVSTVLPLGLALPRCFVKSLLGDYTLPAAVADAFAVVERVLHESNQMRV